MKRLLIATLCFSLIGLFACSKGNDTQPENGNGPDKGVSVGNGRGENYLRMDADLTDARALIATLPDDSTQGKRLMKITAGNKFEEIFSGRHKLYSFKVTPTHIIAHVNIWEDNMHCSLIAIPKIQGKTPVLCLNRQLVNCDSDSNQVGYDVRGTEVFFAYQETQDQTVLSCLSNSKRGELGASISELRHWDGKTEKVQTLFHSNPEANNRTQLLVRAVFVSETNGNLCIDTFNGGDNSLFCRNGNSEHWTKLRVGNGSYTPFLKQGNFLLSSSRADHVGRLNLEDFTTSKRIGTLPSIVDFRLDNGGFLGRDHYYKKLILVLPDGNSTDIMSLEDVQVAPARVGNWGWYMSGESLKRFNLLDGTADHTEFFPQTTLLKPSALYWTLGDFLRIDGTSTKGMPAKSYLNEDGTLLYVDAPVINVEHPIDLKWDK